MVDIVGAAHVDAAGGLLGDHQLGLGIPLPGHDHLLNVAAGEGADLFLGRACLDAEALHQLGGFGLDGLGLEEHGAGVVAAAVIGGDQVVLDAGLGGAAVHHAVFWDIAHARFPLFEDIEPLNGLAGQLDGAILEVDHAGNGANQLFLAVALDAGDAENLAAPDGKVHVLHLGDTALAVAEATDVQNQLGVLHRLFQAVVGALQLGADDQLGELVDGDVGSGVGTLGFAVADDRDPVADLLDFAQLVGDEDDGVANFLKGFELRKERFGFLGRQHGGGLVQDDDFGVAVKGLEDFHLLLGADGEVFHLFRHVNVEVVLVRQLLRPTHCLLHVDKRGLPRFRAQDDVLGHRKGRDQHKVLVHHADAIFNGIHGTLEVDLLALIVDFAGGLLLDGKDDLHQGGFARAVFADDGVNLTLFQLNVDVLVGYCSVGIDLGNVFKF